jgi:hypothetical protein
MLVLFCVFFFKRLDFTNYLPRLASILISASQVARIPGVSPEFLATGDWTQGHANFYFKVVILLVSASQVAGITDFCYWIWSREETPRVDVCME